MRACGARSSRLRVVSQSINGRPIRSISSLACYAPQLPAGGPTSPRATAPPLPIRGAGADARSAPATTRRTKWSPQGARIGWLDGEDLLLRIDSACRTAKAMAAGGDGITLGVATLIKRAPERSECPLSAHYQLPQRNSP